MKKKNIISPSDEVRIVNAFKYWYETNTEKGVTSIPDYICKGLLDLYQKEKEKNKEAKEMLDTTPKDLVHKVFEINRAKIVNSNDYIHKAKIKYYYKKICASVNHFQCKTDNNIVLRIKKYLEELLEEGDK